ncbi:hypothetical protein ACLVWU_11115 [Bdellovibrio sp. HCB290]|uniref:hypothetical protein n=1 Tax=Bdellovibrio sp. HCB290 TaxID=3394356 RepID=UPI0039B562C1
MLGIISKSIAVIVVIASLFCSAYAFADDSDDTMAAIEKTQQDLKNAQTRQGMINGSKEATEVSKQIKSMTGNSANEQELYNLASDVLGNMKGLSSEQLAQVIQQAQKDPEGFLKTWSPEQRKKLENLAERMPAAGKGKRP